MKAILLPYSCNQNEPSRPLSKVVELPTTEVNREKLLKKLFIEHVCADFNEDEISVRRGNNNDYGDIIVEGPHELYLFVTFIEEPPDLNDIDL